MSIGGYESFNFAIIPENSITSFNDWPFNNALVALTETRREIADGNCTGTHTGRSTYAIKQRQKQAPSRAGVWIQFHNTQA